MPTHDTPTDHVWADRGPHAAGYVLLTEDEQFVAVCLPALSYDD